MQFYRYKNVDDTTTFWIHRPRSTTIQEQTQRVIRHCIQLPSKHWKSEALSDGKVDNHQSKIYICTSIYLTKQCIGNPIESELPWKEISPKKVQETELVIEKRVANNEPIGSNGKTSLFYSYSLPHIGGWEACCGVFIIPSFLGLLTFFGFDFISFVGVRVNTIHVCTHRPPTSLVRANQARYDHERVSWTVALSANFLEKKYFTIFVHWLRNRQYSLTDFYLIFLHQWLVALVFSSKSGGPIF